MEGNTTDQVQLVAFCGLYCVNCGRYRKGKCPGCKDNQKATWCKIRTCCLEKDIANCSACDTYNDPKECGKFNNILSRVIEMISGTDRSLCIRYLQNKPVEKFVEMMNDTERMNIPKEKGRQRRQEE